MLLGEHLLALFLCSASRYCQSHGENLQSATLSYCKLWQILLITLHPIHSPQNSIFNVCHQQNFLENTITRKEVKSFIKTCTMANIKKKTFAVPICLVCLCFTAQKTAGAFPFSRIVLSGVIGNDSRQCLCKLFSQWSFSSCKFRTVPIISAFNEHRTQIFADQEKKESKKYI